LAVAFGNTDPAVRNPVEIDQIVGFDLARLSQAGNDLLDQERVVLAQLNYSGGNTPTVKTDRHDQTPTARGSEALPVRSATGGGFNNAGTFGMRREGRA
jgi:hypothetical protein